MMTREQMMEQLTPAQRDDVLYQARCEALDAQARRDKSIALNGDPNARWYAISLNAVGAPIPEHPTTRKVAAGVLAVVAVAATWWGSLHLPHVDGRPDSQPVPEMKK
jgi:hypothetical protein